MKYTLRLLVVGSFSLIIGVPHLHVYLTGNPAVNTEEIEPPYDDSFEFPTRKDPTPSMEITFPALANTQFDK